VKNIIKLLTWIAWGLLFVDSGLIFLIPADANFGRLVWLIAYLAWLIVTLLAATTWLIIYHRRLFRLWPGWLMTVALLLFSSSVAQDVLPIHYPNLSLFFSLLFIISVWDFGIATAILLWYRDVGLGLIGWGGVVFIWAVLLSWRFQGNWVELWIDALNNLESSSPLWWLNTFLCVLGWIIPLGIVSFIGHTLRLFIREYR